MQGSDTENVGILIAEDDNALRGDLVEIVAKRIARCEVHGAWNGEEALEILKELNLRRSVQETRVSIELVVTDNRMPKMGGMDLIEEMQRSGIDIPVFMMTSDQRIDLEQDAQRRGIVLPEKIFAKSRGVKDLIHAINEVLVR